jgi:amino acid transporter
MVSYAGFASPLVVIVAFVASLCCASSIAEFARRLPSAGSLYTYNSHGLGRTGGFLTGWMMVFAYALYVPAGLSLTSAYASQLVADTLHVTIDSWVLFVLILGAVVLVAYLGVRTSSSVDLVLVAGEVAVIAGVFYLLVVVAEAFGVGPGGLADFTRQGNPLGYLTSRYWSPSALWAIDLVVVLTGLGFVIASLNVAIRVLFAMGREGALPGSLARLSSRHTPVVSIACVATLALALGLPLTYAVGGGRTFRYLAGAGGLSVVLVYLAVNIAAIRAFRTEFRDEFRLWRHLLVPATAAVLMLFPLWGILHPRARTLVDLLPFAALGWLCLGAIVAGVLWARRPASFETLGRVFTQPADNNR